MTAPLVELLELSLLLPPASPPRSKRSCRFVNGFQNESLPLVFFFFCMLHLPFSMSDKMIYRDLNPKSKAPVPIPRTAHNLEGCHRSLNESTRQRSSLSTTCSNDYLHGRNRKSRRKAASCRRDVNRVEPFTDFEWHSCGKGSVFKVQCAWEWKTDWGKGVL